MRPPFCNYEIDEAARPLENGRVVADPLAIALPCNCASGHFKDFAERLERFHRELRLGFDCTAGCYMVYRRLPNGIYLRIKPCQWVVIRRVNGGNKFFHFPRDPGDWLLRDLQEYAPAQFELDGSWVGPKADAMAKAATAENDRKVREIGGQVWDDVMSVADRGDPTKIRTGVMVNK
jgi:hypothetical protein